MRLNRMMLVKNSTSTQRIERKGRIVVEKRGWIVRAFAIVIISFVIIFNLEQGIKINDFLVIYSTLMPLHALMIMIVGWFFYRNPANGRVGTDLVSVIIPVYNQSSMIETVVDAIVQSTYNNIEIIAVDDGCKDGSKEILDRLQRKYHNLKVIHKKNEGKRKAVAAGFYVSSGRYVILIDSDSIIDKNAIAEFMKTFDANPEVGAVVGEAKVWNSEKNWLTKCQDVWYDYAFNIHKTTESVLGNVMCCSGCLAGYRREAIANFMPYWVRSGIPDGNARDLTSYAIAMPWAKRDLMPISRIIESNAQYDDAEDRMLTAQAIVEWKSVYVATAVAYTDVPEKFSRYVRQQTRWKKGFIRSNFFVSTFFWKKNPLMAFIFYTEFMTAFTAPLIVSIVLFYEPFILKRYLITGIFLSGLLLTGLAHGLDYKFRVIKTRNWIYKPFMNLVASLLLSTLVFPALLTYNKNQWLTR